MKLPEEELGRLWLETVAHIAAGFRLKASEVIGADRRCITDHDITLAFDLSVERMRSYGIAPQKIAMITGHTPHTIWYSITRYASREDPEKEAMELQIVRERREAQALAKRKYRDRLKSVPEPPPCPEPASHPKPALASRNLFLASQRAVQKR